MIRKSIDRWIPSQDITELFSIRGLLAGAQTPSNPWSHREARVWELVTAEPSNGPAWHGGGCLRADSARCRPRCGRRSATSANGRLLMTCDIVHAHCAALYLSI